MCEIGDRKVTFRQDVDDRNEKDLPRVIPSPWEHARTGFSHDIVLISLISVWFCWKSGV